MPSTRFEPAIRAPLMAPTLVAFVLGAAVQLQQAELSGWLIYASIVLIVPVAWALLAIKERASRKRSWRRPRVFFWPELPTWLVSSVLCLSAAAFSFSMVGLRASAFLAHQLAAEREGKDISVTGVVAAMPQRNEAGLRFRLDVESARDASGPVSLPPRIDLGWYSGVFGGAASTFELHRQPAEISAGERWQMTVRLKAPHGGSNPHGFDFELWMWEQGLQATGYVRAGPKDPAPLRLAQTWQHPVEVARQQVRDAILERVANPKLAGVIAALVVGDQRAIDRADWDIYRATGVAHLMSISGLHVTMFAWVAALCVGWLWRRSQRLCLAWPASSAGLVGGVLLAGLYAVFSGWGVPSQRTVLMLATVGLLRLSAKQWPWPHVWMLACALVVAVDPWALMQPGFWLSFVAVGVLFATDSGANKQALTGTSERFDGKFFDGPPLEKLAPLGGSVVRIATSVGAGLREQWVITIALTPLTLMLFGQVSVVGLAANVLAIPWVTLVVTPLAMGGVLIAPLWDAAAWAVQALAWYLQFLVQLPFATVSVAKSPLWAGTLGLIGASIVVCRLPWSARLLGVPLMLPVLLWQAPRPAMGQFELLVADIGQGNAVLVRTAGHALVFDAGPRFSRESDAGHRVVVPLLKALDVQVTTVMLSHRDIDHTGGALAVLAQQPQAALISSIEDAHELQAMRKATRCETGQHWQWDGVDFDVLRPLATDYSAGLKPNALSCVLRISNGVQSALLVGDIEQPQEAQLLASGQALKADVLLMPHHGSKTSSSEAFLDAVKPRIALVQAGYRNRFGHPAAPVLDRYAQRGIAVFDSPRCGAATWDSVRPQAVRCQRKEALRYWHHRPTG